MKAYNILENGSSIGSGSGLVNQGTVSFSATDSSGIFAVNGNVSGAPKLSSPNFSSNKFTTSEGIAGILTIMVTETGRISSTGNLNNTFTVNSLTDPNCVSGTITNYFDASKTAFGMGTALARASFSGNNSFSKQQGASAAFAAPFPRRQSIG